MNSKDNKLIVSVYKIIINNYCIDKIMQIDFENIDIYKNKEYLYLIININEKLLCKYNYNEIIWSLKIISYYLKNSNKNIFNDYKNLNLLADVCVL